MRQRTFYNSKSTHIKGAKRANSIGSRAVCNPVAAGESLLRYELGLLAAKPDDGGIAAVASTENFALGVRCAPNPASDEVTVSYNLPEAATVSIDILDALQRMVAQPVDKLSQTANGYDVVAPVRKLTPGVYSVRVTGATTSGKFFQEYTQLSIIR